MEQRKQQDDLENYADMEVGGLLRRARLHYGQSLQDIERTLRIRESQIDAIERGDVEKLPGRVYAIGFVRSYAEYLGLDGDKIVHLFKAQYMNAQPSRSELVFPVAASETKTPPLWLVLSSVVVAIAILSAWAIKNRTDRTQITEIPDVPAQITQRLDEEPLLPEQQEELLVEELPEVVEAQKGIVLNITEKSWVEIKDNEGKTIVSSVLEPGDQYFVPDSPGLTISLGNAGGVEILLNGKALKSLGARGDVRHNIPLDSTYLKTLEFKESLVPEPEQEALEAAPNAAPEDTETSNANPSGE